MSLIGPERRLLRDSDMSGIGVKAEVASDALSIADETLNEHPPDLSSPGLLTNVDL